MYTYGNLIGGAKHPAVIAFEEDIKKRPCKGVVIKVPLPVVCSMVCELEGTSSGRNLPLVSMCDLYFLFRLYVRDCYVIAIVLAFLES